MPTVTDDYLAKVSTSGEPYDPNMRELALELIKAREALKVAKEIAQLGPILKTAIFAMGLEGDNVDELQLAIIHKKPDGSGHVGPSWALGEFAKDLEKLATLVNSKEEQEDLTAMGLTAVFGGGQKH